MSLKSYVNRKLTRLVVRCSRNHYNRLFTWYFNIKYLPWKQAKYLPIAFYGRPRLLADEHQQIEIQTDRIYSSIIVTAGSLVNKDFSAEESSTMFAGIPAVPTSKRCILLRNNDQLLFDFFEVHPTSGFRVINANDFLYNKTL